MDDEALTLDPEKQHSAKKLARIKRWLMLAELTLGTLYLGLWIGLRWNLGVREWLSGWLAQILGVSFWWLDLLGFTLVLAVPYLLISLPFDLYGGFVLPHRFELSTQTPAGWISDQVKGLTLSAGLGAPLLVGLYALLRASPLWWWAWAGALYTLVTAVLAALAPVLLMPIFYKVVPLDETYAGLRARLLALAQRVGAHVEGVYQIDMSRRTKAANAALAGLGKTRRILLGDTLLQDFSDDEIETVLAHELGHHVHRDIPLSIFAQAVFNFAGLWLVDLGLKWGVTAFGLSGLSDPAGLPWIALLLGAFALVTTPLANAFSRWREGMADDFALEVTAKPAAFASAMTRLANQNLSEADPAPWIVFLLYSHPPLGARVAKARAQEQAGVN